LAQGCQVRLGPPAPAAAMAPKPLKTKPAAKVIKTIKLLKFVKKQKSSKGKGRGTGDLESDAVLACTAKATSCNLLLQQRCVACHGELVRDVVGKVMDDGKQYKMADLRYDMKGGRLVVLPPGSQAGEIPKGKPRPDAPLAGKPLPNASLDEFFMFLQCQLRMELRQHTGNKLELPDKDADAMWPDVEAFITPNLGATERWVPYHTVLGVHELFLVESVHSRKKWSEYQRFVAMFVFRAHCKRDLFTTAELPHMLKDSFWKDPKAAFKPGGPMEKSILEYRKKTGAPLITSCFRIIPPRVLADDTQNLVRSITDRTMNLIEVAEKAWVVVKDKKKSSVEKITEISTMIQQAQGCGDTWAKMLTVCIDLAYPSEQFLEKQCDVGTGAAPPLRCLLGEMGDASNDRARGLKTLLKSVNASKSAHAKHFWATLKKAEGLIGAKFKSLPLIGAQAKTKEHCMTACTLQVQLCEYRQFRHSIARLKYGLPDDESMRGNEDEKRTTTLEAEDFIELSENKKCAVFDIPVAADKKVHFEVPLKATGNRKMVAARVAAMCFVKIRDGASKQEAQSYCDSLLAGFREGEDVPDDCEAWAECKTQLSHSNPLVAFQMESKDGKFPFQTTKAAAGGSILEAERIARLCWVKLSKGMKKDAVIEYRNSLYAKRAAEDGVEGPPIKKARKSGA